MAVWMDCVEENKAVPVYQNTIIAKITRLSLEDFHDDVHDEDDIAFPDEELTDTSHHAASPVALSSNTSIPAQQQPDPRSSPVPVFDVFDGPSHAPAPLAPAPRRTSTPTVPAQTHHHHNDLLDPHTPATTGTHDFFANSSTTPAAPNTSSFNDFIGMQATPSTVTHAQQPPQPHHQQQQQAYPNHMHAQQQQQYQQQQQANHHTSAAINGGRAAAGTAFNQFAAQNKPKQAFDDFSAFS